MHLTELPARPASLSHQPQATSCKHQRGALNLPWVRSSDTLSLPPTHTAGSETKRLGEPRPQQSCQGRIQRQDMLGGWQRDRQTDTGTGTGVERAAVVVLPLGTAAEDVGMWDVLI